jgi:hypothetical protein
MNPLLTLQCAGIWSVSVCPSTILEWMVRMCCPLQSTWSRRHVSNHGRKYVWLWQEFVVDENMGWSMLWMHIDDSWDCVHDVSSVKGPYPLHAIALMSYLNEAKVSHFDWCSKVQCIAVVLCIAIRMQNAIVMYLCFRRMFKWHFRAACSPTTGGPFTHGLKEILDIWYGCCVSRRHVEYACRCCFCAEVSVVVPLEHWTCSNYSHSFLFSN